MDSGTQAQHDPKAAKDSGLTGETEDRGGSQAKVAHLGLDEEKEAIASAKAALDRATSRLADASRELNEIVNFLKVEGDPRQLRDAQDVLAQIHSVDNILNVIFRRGRGQEPADAFSAVTQASALESDAEAAVDRLPGDDSGGGPNRPDPPGWLRAHWNAAVASIKSALPQVWAFISGMVTPSQWTVEGSVSTGLFGFAGVSVSVTFGKGG
jgi:hypothetical protein